LDRTDLQLWKAREVVRLLALLEKDRRYYQRLLSALPMGVAVLSANRQIVATNKAFRNLLGLTIDELVDKSIDQILPSERLLEAIRAANIGGMGPGTGGVEVTATPGARRLHVTVTPLAEGLDDEGPETLLMIQAAGATESGIETSPEQPAKTATPSGAYPSQAQAVIAGRRDALQSLAGRLAHDLNNPLMIIAGYAEEILHGLKADDAMRAEMEQIVTATERMTAITEQLLDFTRRHANPPQGVNVTAELTILKEGIARAAGVGARVEIAAPKRAVWALAEAEQLEEAILALVAAGGARPRSRITVGCTVETVTASNVLKPGMYARITIEDDGPAFPPEKSAMIFESFLAPKDPKQGVAAQALARAYSVVREWNGDLVLSTGANGGSIFSIYLPQSEPETGANSISSRPARMENAEIRGTILLAEDEEGIRALIRKILRREKYEVLEAASGEEALKIAAAHPGRIDLLVTDVMLTGITGRILAERMLERLPDLRVLYISGYTGDETVRAGAAPRGSQFLQKPFTLGALVNAVREALKA
jgi:CheY-like chemotaxis protein